MITKENKVEAIKKTQLHAKDVGSAQAQISVLTSRIKELSDHLATNKNDKMARRGLIQQVGKRKKLLKYLESSNFDSYKKTVTDLGLRK